MENARGRLRLGKSKRVDPKKVEFLVDVTEAEKAQVKKDIVNSTFDPNRPQAHEGLDPEGEEYKLRSRALALAKNSAKDRRKARKVEKSRAWNEVAEPRIEGKFLNLLSYNFLNLTNSCL